MPKGIYTHKPCTEETKKKLSKLFKGRIPCNKNKKDSWETKKKKSESHKGKKYNPMSFVGRMNISKAKKGKLGNTTGKHWKIRDTSRMRNKIGKKNGNWKDGLTSINSKIRSSIEYRLWRESVFARDNWTCQKYGTKGGKLVVHHIKNFAEFPELRFAIDNGITLSDKAHREFHKKYGIKNNTKEQLEEFLIK